jgi:hypothetical protein
VHRLMSMMGGWCLHVCVVQWVRMVLQQLRRRVLCKGYGLKAALLLTVCVDPTLRVAVPRMELGHPGSTRPCHHHCRSTLGCVLPSLNMFLLCAAAHVVQMLCRHKFTRVHS